MRHWNLILCFIGISPSLPVGYPGKKALSLGLLLSEQSAWMTVFNYEDTQRHQ